MATTGPPCCADPRYATLQVDVDAKAVVGGYNACAPHYSHANEIVEGDTALHVAIRNRKKEVTIARHNGAH